MPPTPAWRSPTTTPLSIAGGIMAGTVLIVAGLTLAYATFVVPLVGSLAGGGPFGTPNAGGGALASALAVVAMAAFLGVGAARLAGVLATVRPARRVVRDPLLAGLPEHVLLVRGVDVGDGRAVPAVLLGRFGAAVVRELPDAAATRRQGAYWEAWTSDGWIRIENPLDRAARDAERLRRWFSHDDRDFVVRVYAAVITTEPTIPRTPTCAVIGTNQLPAWLASLPVQRSLTDARRTRLGQMVRGRRP
jgi:hypothetical protein